MELFPPIHRLDLGRSPRPGSGLRLSGRGGGDAGEKTGDTTPPPGSAAAGSAFFRGFAPPALSAFLRGRTRAANPQVRSGPLAIAAWAALSPAARADSGPRPLRWGDGGDAGEQVGGSGPEAAPAPLPGSVPAGLAPVRGLRCSQPLLAAATP
ncbi:hypothetical protein NDU88_007447 [Pleurodeles waltl]|uniref:Uncharacterized protein n=1 Tax=Pleurodeles waltl TaxID=8319 RepID=A0AAV7VTL4_PLEWA|nr:hypothetical protein NDU88_007447 [Pleurodeles waltl]